MSVFTGTQSAASQPQNPRQPLLQQLEKLLFLIDALEKQVGSFNVDPPLVDVDQQELLIRRLMQYIEEVKALKDLAPICEDRVPVDLLKFVDEGGHPDVYTTNAFKQGMKDNQASKGKVQAIRALRDALMQRAEVEMPEHATAYRTAIEGAKETAMTQAEPSQK